MKASKPVPLNRALSKLGILSRSQAVDAICAGRVTVDGRIVRDPASPVVPERASIEVDGQATSKKRWRTVVFHKPRGVVTTRSDPEGRPTVYDVLGEAGRGLIPVGRLDMASSGLLMLTTDTRLANRITDPASDVVRVYVVTVRGRVTEDEIALIRRGVGKGRDRVRAHAAELRKASARESHLMIELREGKNREVRRLFEAAGHEVTRLKRIRIGSLALGELQPGEWREVTREEAESIFRT